MAANASRSLAAVIFGFLSGAGYRGLPRRDLGGSGCHLRLCEGRIAQCLSASTKRRHRVLRGRVGSDIPAPEGRDQTLLGFASKVLSMEMTLAFRHMA